ncbi:MAG: hypothetical protein NE327_12505 [Lentisphaeraceae bacterium]|nr:hypothetical protein [Lentisphaeraceae bacterium]
MKVLLAIILSLGGLIIGGFLGLYAPFFISLLFDYFSPPTGNGGGLTAVSWAFCFITIPMFAIIGAVSFPVIVLYKGGKKDRFLKEITNSKRTKEDYENTIRNIQNDLSLSESEKSQLISGLEEKIKRADLK